MIRSVRSPYAAPCRPSIAATVPEASAAPAPQSHFSWRQALFAAPVLAGVLAGGAMAAPEPAEPSVVRIESTPHGFTLLRDGKPYLIEGSGGDESLDELHAIGANSVRTWGSDGADTRLAAAQQRGMTVTLGIWLGQQTYLDYSKDSPALEQQRAMVKDAAARYKDSPALLLWGLGNETETGGDPGNPALWKEIDREAQSIKQVDPNHPVMTVVAEISPEKIAAIKKYAPHVDVLGVNSYGAASTLPERLRQDGWTKPYVITEFGPRGAWESQKTPWGAPLEQTSTEKAAMYRTSWQTNVPGPGGASLGGYAFVWGHKWEASNTWCGMFLPGTEERLGSVDTMQKLWTGHAPAHPVPTIAPLKSDASAAIVAPGSAHKVTASAASSSGYPIAYRWEIEPEAQAGVVSSGAGGPSVQFTAPTAPGAYRFYVYASDGHGGAATADFPFLVAAGR